VSRPETGPREPLSLSLSCAAPPTRAAALDPERLPTVDRSPLAAELRLPAAEGRRWEASDDRLQVVNFSLRSSRLPTACKVCRRGRPTSPATANLLRAAACPLDPATASSIATCSRASDLGMKATAWVRLPSRSAGSAFTASLHQCQGAEGHLPARLRRARQEAG
jgi:hypothetical protein